MDKSIICQNSYDCVCSDNHKIQTSYKTYLDLLYAQIWIVEKNSYPVKLSLQERTKFSVPCFCHSCAAVRDSYPSSKSDQPWFLVKSKSNYYKRTTVTEYLELCQKSPYEKWLSTYVRTVHMCSAMAKTSNRKPAPERRRNASQENRLQKAIRVLVDLDLPLHPSYPISSSIPH